MMLSNRFLLLFVQSRHKNEDVFKSLRPQSCPGVAAAGYGLRINNPFEEKFRANWHQEYPAQLRSLDGLVFWSPLVSVTKELGPVTICPESHKEGPIAVYTNDPKHKERTGAYSLVLENESALIDKYNQIAPLSKPTDLIVIDFLLLHASGFNKSDRALWSMQFRYFNYLEKRAFHTDGRVGLLLVSTLEIFTQSYASTRKVNND